MKKFYKILYLAVTASVMLITGCSNERNNNTNAGAQEPPENSSSRALWEYERHRDPKTGQIPKDIRAREALFVSKLPGASINMKFSGNSVLGQDWARRGPAEVGGRTRALAYDIMDENIILAGGVSGGMWRTTDGGSTWSKTTTPFQLHSVSCIAQDTRVGRENIWYYGTGEFWGNSADISGDGIYKSTDGGRSWSPLLSTATFIPGSWENSFDYIWRIVLNHKNTQQDEIYAATALGAITRSTDGGLTWKNVLGGFGNSYSYFTEIIITPSGVFYAALSQYSPAANSQVRGIYRSTDGVNWTNITPQDMPPKYKRIIPAFAPSDESIVYFAAETPGSGILTTNSQGDSLWHSFWKYTYVSGDGSGAGGVWENRTQNLPKPNLVRHHFNTQGSYNFTMKVKPDDPETIIIGAVNLYRTTDGFKTTGNTTLIGGTCPESGSLSNCEYFYRYPNHHADQHEILFSKKDYNILYTGTDGGVHKTLDCMAKEVEWISLNNSYFTTQFYTCAIDHKAVNDEIIGGLQDNGTLFTRWNDLGKAWTIPGNGDGFHCAIADNGEYYYASQNSSYQPKIKIFRNKLDKEGKVVSKTRIDPIGGEGFLWNTPFKLDPNDSKRMYLCGGRMLWRNNDMSQIPEGNAVDSTSIGWDSIGVHIPLLISGEFLSAVEISQKPANVVYYGTTRGKLFKLANADSKDYTYTNVTGKDFPSGGYISSIATDPDNAENVFVTFSNYNVMSIFNSTNGGQDWAPVAGNLEESIMGGGSGPAVHYLEILPVGPRKLYLAATSAGLFSTTFIDGRYTVWQMEGPQLIGNMVINMIDSRAEDGFVAVASHGAGMFYARVQSLASAPGTPLLLSPSDNTMGVGKSVKLYWKPVEGAFYYKVQISRDASFGEIYKEYDGIQSDSVEFDEVEQGLKVYYWRVIARGSGGLSQPSETWQITSAVEYPVLLSPANKEENVALPVVLKWQPVTGAAGYNLLISTNLAFTNIALDTTGIKGTEVTVSNLEKGKKYYWKVSAFNSDGAGLYSPFFIFYTELPSAVAGYGSDNRIEISPTPAGINSIVRIRFTELNKPEIRIIDITGKALEIPFSGAGGNYQFSTNGLMPGTYLIKLVINDMNYVRKLLVE